MLVTVIKNWSAPDLSRQLPQGSLAWNGVNFTFEPATVSDYVVILNCVPQDTVLTCPPENIWAFIQEPFLPNIFDWINQGHQQFHKVFTPHSNQAGGKYCLTQTCLPWHVEKSFDDLHELGVPKKLKDISCISSNKSVFAGHLHRRHFVHSLCQIDDLQIDFFGFGINPIEDKWHALAPYRYSIAIENSSSAHYWTEKLADCFLAYTLPIYYGCINLEEYFPPDSFVRVDIEDVEGSVIAIKKIIAEDTWQKRLPAIKEARDLVLNKYQLFPFLVDRINADSGAMREKKAVYIRGYNKEIGYLKKPDLLISVVVCTYNRQDMLPECLASLLNQTFNPAQYEVIVVNNNSLDGTERIASDFVQGKANFRLLNECRQGLSHARNAGYTVAQGEYVAFIDDDARAPADWLEAAARIIAAHSPDIFGGPVNALFEDESPDWYKEAYGKRGDMGETGFITEGFIVGTNIFFRKELLEEYGGFDPNLGMKGDKVGYHEETALVHRAFTEKRKVYYSSALVVADNLPSYKHSLAFFMYARYKAGYDGVQLWGQKPSIDNVATLIATIDNTFNEMDFALRKRDTGRYLYPENYVVEQMGNHFVDIGKLIRLIQNSSGLNPVNDNVGGFSALNLVINISRTTGLARFLFQLMRETVSLFFRK